MMYTSVALLLTTLSGTSATKHVAEFGGLELHAQLIKEGISAIKNNRRRLAKEESPCEIVGSTFEEFEDVDGLVKKAKCMCTQGNETSISIECSAEDHCIKHTSGTSYTGTVTVSVTADFPNGEDINVEDSLCFEYDSDDTEACISGAIWPREDKSCDATFADGKTCSKCKICDAEQSLVETDCTNLDGGKKVNECKSETLHETPLQFFSIENSACASEKNQPAFGSSGAGSVGVAAAAIITMAAAMMI